MPSAVAAQAADEGLSTPTYWTGTNTEGPPFAVPGGPIGTIPGGYRTTIGLTYTAEADDPRASGEVASSPKMAANVAEFEK